MIKRFTFRYPEEKLKFVGDGYQFDPKRGVGMAGYRGRHILFHDKCAGCQLCAIACEGIAEILEWSKLMNNGSKTKKPSCHKSIMENASFVDYALMPAHSMLCT